MASTSTTGDKLTHSGLDRATININDSNLDVNPHHRITFGSFNCKNDRLSSVGKEITIGHSHCMVIVAWMYHFKHNPYDWDVNHLDNIICKGDWMYFMFRCEPGHQDVFEKYNMTSSAFLAHIKMGVFTVKDQYVFEPITKLAFFGSFTGLRSNLNNYMESCDETARCILFICKQISFGIFGYIGREGVVEYCLFDPHGRNSNGYFDYTEKSCMLYFKTIDNLMDLLARDGLFAYSRYECIPMKKSPITFKLSFVNVHNSKKFVGDYLYRVPGWNEDWRDSSSSSFDSSDFDDSESDEELPRGKPVLTKVTAKGRTIKKPDRYESEPHPSFFRGKLREDRKRQNFKWQQWYDSKNSEERRRIKMRKKIDFKLFGEKMRRTYKYKDINYY